MPDQDSAARQPPLRIGVLVDEQTLPRFEEEILRRIQASQFANIEVVIRAPKLTQSAPTATHPSAVFHRYERRDLRRRNDPANDPLAKVDCRGILVAVPSVELASEPRREGAADASAQDAIAGELRELSLDVVIQLGSCALPAEYMSLCRYGVWSILLGDPNSDTSGPPYFWETYRNDAVSTAAVLVHDAQRQLVVEIGHFATRPTSLAWNRRQPCWTAVALLLQRLEVLAHRGWDAASCNAVAYAPRMRRFISPSNSQMLRWLARDSWQKLAKRIQGRTVKHWRIATRVGGQIRPADGRADLGGFRFHESPQGHFYADPMLWNRDGRNWLFFEDYHYATHLGTISCAEVLPDGALGPTMDVLSRPYHLSFPFLLEDGGELYMIPESGDNGAIELFRCVEFPDRWEYDCALLDFAAVDTTITWIGDRYWLFTSVPEPRANAMQLQLYSSPSLRGEWTPHPCNPISNDIRCNRGGGAMFIDGERVIRVSQDGSRIYGHSFSFHEIVDLTPETYRERLMLNVDPSWSQGLIGTHTYARCGDVEAVDGVMRRRRKGTAV